MEKAGVFKKRGTEGEKGRVRGEREGVSVERARERVKDTKKRKKRRENVERNFEE